MKETYSDALIRQDLRKEGVLNLAIEIVENDELIPRNHRTIEPFL